MKQKKYFFCLFSIISLTIYTVIIIKFVSHDGLSTFASDSANYMLMGLYMSPWKEATAPIQALWQFQDFPPFFPFILAITGTVHNMYAAHILTTIFMTISLPLIYIFSRRCFASAWQAFWIVAIFALSPSTWLNNMGILSENLYIFISFLTICLFPKQRQSNIYFSVLMGLLFTLLILTRTIGISMLFAYSIVGFIMWQNKSLSIQKFITPIILTIFSIIFIKTFNPSSIPSQYLQQLIDLNISGQPDILLDTWFTAWQYYWADDLIIPHLLVLLIGILAGSGLIIRIKLLKLDAFYVLFYICILLVWPHPGQDIRFIYPIHALFIIYAFFFIHILFKEIFSKPDNKPIIVLLLISLSIIVPTLSYLWNRYQIGKENGYNHILEFYRFPDLEHARNLAATETTMFNDMKVINQMTNPEDKILHFTPVYIALLANRNSRSISYNYTDENAYRVNNISDAEYVYISKLHPRKTGKDFNGLDLKVYFSGKTKTLWTHYSSENGEIISIFLKTIK